MQHRHGNYLSWPLINVKNVTKYFPELEETQKGHMQGQWQGVCSTKEAESPDENQTIIPHVKKHDILILVYDTKATMYSDQSGKFPAVSNKGNKYVMVLHGVDSNSSWAKPMKNQTGSELILARNPVLTKCDNRASTQNSKSSTIKHRNLTMMPSGHRA